jgi:hypothetical protein
MGKPGEASPWEKQLRGRRIRQKEKRTGEKERIGGGERKGKNKIKINSSSSGGEIYRESGTAALTRTDVALRSACLVSSGEYDTAKKSKRDRGERCSGLVEGIKLDLICRCTPGIGKR